MRGQYKSADYGGAYGRRAVGPTTAGAASGMTAPAGNTLAPAGSWLIFVGLLVLTRLLWEVAEAS